MRPRNATPVLVLKIIGAIVIGLPHLPMLPWAVCLGFWNVALEVAWARRFGGFRYPIIVRAMQWAGFALMASMMPKNIAGLIVLVAFVAMWDLLVELAWDQRFPWG